MLWWRGLERITIQDLLIAAVQNIRILIRHARKPSGVALEMRMAGHNATPVAVSLYHSLSIAKKFFREVLRLSHNRRFELTYS